MQPCVRRLENTVDEMANGGNFMNRLLKIFIGGLFLILFFTAGAFSMGNNKLVPMKLYPAVDIPDGEFLHYGFLSAGEKSSDYYFVTRKITDGKGGFFYRCYEDIISISSRRKPDKNYTSWPIYYDIDPKLGSVISSVGNLTAEDTKDWPKAPSGEIFLSWNYRLDNDKGTVEYSSKMLKGKETNESKSLVKFSTGFPSTDQWGGSTLFRLLDPRSGGVYYVITAMYMKEPMPFTIKYISTETIETKAGTFRVDKLNNLPGDPFLGKLGTDDEDFRILD